ncbi:hypothetical protein OIO90_004528 [Microbotryomycetes sp. JL221]|nr:hypothetical protein OIO90_004528 [Microbotryomycetes sp. JL221]
MNSSLSVSFNVDLGPVQTLQDAMRQLVSVVPPRSHTARKKTWTVSREHQVDRHGLGAHERTEFGVAAPLAPRRQAISDADKHGRNLVLIFDGTNNTFEAELTSLPTEPLLSHGAPLTCILTFTLSSSYQTGIGTYTNSWSPAGIVSGFWKLLDSAIAFNLPEHVKGGYEYLCNYYQPGDKIYLFGFSRGAYTARALAGMLQQVGLLLPGNKESIDLAYQIYSEGANAKLSPQTTIGLADAFHEMFSRTISIHYIGVWDTVASVGALKPKTLPFSAGSSMISHFRHALALDEHRVRFIPQVWLNDDAATNSCQDGSKVLPLDSSCSPTTKEVWFVGCHSNIGGGQTATDGDVVPRLSHIPLRWHIREAVEQGLLLDIEVVETSPLYAPFVETVKHMFDDKTGEAKDKTLRLYLDKFKLTFHPEMDLGLCALVYVATLPSEEAKRAACAPRGDRLSLEIAKVPGASRFKGLWDRVTQRLATLPWKLLEWLPLTIIQWDVAGKPLHSRSELHRGKGRALPPNPVFHFTVRDRMNATHDDFVKAGQGLDNSSVTERVPYKPKARFVHGDYEHEWDDGGF